jgi:membrane-associated phospholipid phosphatase
MIRKALFFLFFILICSKTLHAGSDYFQKIPKDTIFKKDTASIFKGFVHDEARLWTSPLRITKKRFCFWVPIIGATMISLANDEKIYNDFISFEAKHKWVKDVSPIITYGGDGKPLICLSGLIYLSGIAFNNEKAKQTAIMGIEALCHAGLIVTVGKLTTGRQRPEFDNGIDEWHWFPATFRQFGSDPQPKYDAFPSGHTIAVWSVATVIAKQYKDCILVPIIAYTVATGVGLSRIMLSEHWMSDVIIGGALGYTIGSFEVRERKNTKWSLFPSSNGKSIMLSSVYKL